MSENNFLGHETENAGGNGRHKSGMLNAVGGYGGFIQSLAVPAYQCDLNGHIINYNKAAVELWGKKPLADNDLWGASIQIKDADGNVVRLNAHPMVAAIQEAVAQQPKELELLRLDGSTRHVLAHAAPTFNEDGTINGATNIIVDISRYKGLEESKAKEKISKQAIEELRLTRLAIDNAIEVIIITDAPAEGNPIIYANRSFYSLTGYQAEEVLGKNCRFLQGPDSDSEVIAAIAKRLDEKELYSGELLNYKKDGTPFWNSLNIIPIVDELGSVTHFVGFQSDITEKKLAEEKVYTAHESLEVKVAKRTAQLEDVNKELEAFNYTVSHDLQAPLRTISGFTRILLNEYRDKLGKDANEYLEFIEKSVRQMSMLTKSLLSFSKLGKASLNYSNVDLEEQVQQVIAELKLGDANSKVEILQHGLKPAICDGELIKQVWTNLIGNAVKYSSKKSYPLIEIGMSENEDEELIYYIRDNGSGFNMENAGKLFSPFQRMHSNSEFEGTGVGLATVHRIITKHGGRIWADAKPDEGATFYFTLKGTIKI